MKRFVLVVFAIAAVISLPSNKALACSCMATTPEEVIADSDVVFRGTVTSKIEGSMGANDVAVFSVDSVMKGDIRDRVTIMTPGDSAACGVEYVVGEEYAVAASENDGEWMSFLCSSISIQDLDISHDCDPYVCRDGTVIASCTEDGHVINYFAPPCLTHGGEVGGPIESFTDVGPNNPYYDSITWARENGVVEGYADGTFRPEVNVNRAEFTKILLEANNIDTKALCRMAEFPDSSMQEWYGPYVHAARCHGIVSGYPDGTFKPNGLINFAEAAKIIANVHAGQPLQAHAGDVWYQVYVDYLSERSAIPVGYDLPDLTVQRGAMVEIMYRLAVGLEGIPELGEQSSWTGIIVHSERPAPDIAYDYKLVFDREYRDSLNASDPNMPITSVYVVPAPGSDVRDADLQNAVGSNVFITGKVEWGYAEMRVIDVESIGEDAVACTMDAKACPDGSYVGRIAPKCEFAPCPGY